MCVSITICMQRCTGMCQDGKAAFVVKANNLAWP